jgi:hypothetical protein
MNKTRFKINIYIFFFRDIKKKLKILFKRGPWTKKED